jgi:hypothetical protein
MSGPAGLSNTIKPARGWLPGDADSRAYVATVEAADGQTLPPGVSGAIHTFVIGCKADGTWPAIKAACFLAGPRTLTGSLIPLVGPAPTNYNFVSGDRVIKTGLKGDPAAIKYLSTNRNNNAEPQDSKHVSFWATDFGDTTAGVTTSAIGMGASAAGTTGMLRTGASSRTLRLNSGTLVTLAGGSATATGFIGASRASGTEISTRVLGSTTVASNTSSAPASGNVLLFARGSEGTPTNLAAERIAWYSVGEAIDLSLLDGRLATYMAAIAAADY